MEAITGEEQFDMRTKPEQTQGIIMQLTQIVNIMSKLGDS